MEITILPADKAVEKPGLYQCGNDHYHSQAICPGTSVSSSMLRRVLECPAKFWARSPLNPLCYPDERSAAIDFGAAAHDYLSNTFDGKYVISLYDNYRSQEARDWRDEQTKIVLTVDELSKVQIMAMVRQNDQLASNFFPDDRGTHEVSLFWVDDKTGLWCKARPDFLPNEPGNMFTREYKTARSVEPSAFSRDVFNHGYHVQAAMVIEGIKRVMGIERPMPVAILAQEKEPPFLTQPFVFAPEQMLYGHELFRSALDMFAECLDSGVWPGYSNDVEMIQTPRWVSAEMERFQNEHANDDHGLTSEQAFSAG